MLFELRQFKKEDALLIRDDAVDESVHGDSTVKEWSDYNKKTGPAYTAVLYGRPIGCAGIRIMTTSDGENIGWVWAMFSKEAAQYPVSMFSTVKRMIGILIKDFELSRLVTDSRIGFDKSQRLIEHLGFKKTDRQTDTHYYYELVR